MMDGVILMQEAENKLQEFDPVFTQQTELVLDILCSEKMFFIIGLAVGASVEIDYVTGW